jgi:hypothetical protein
MCSQTDRHRHRRGTAVQTMNKHAILHKTRGRDTFSRFRSLLPSHPIPSHYHYGVPAWTRICDIDTACHIDNRPCFLEPRSEPIFTVLQLRTCTATSQFLTHLPSIPLLQSFLTPASIPRPELRYQQVDTNQIDPPTAPPTSRRSRDNDHGKKLELQ